MKLLASLNMSGRIDSPENKENSVDPNVEDAAMPRACGGGAAAEVVVSDDRTKLLRQLPLLLQALFRDCFSNAEPGATMKRSVQQCLRTKARPPGDQVRSVVAEFRDASPTERSLYTASVASLLVSLKKEATTTSQGSDGKASPSSRTSLYFVSYLFVPIQYLHLLLEVSTESGDGASRDAHRGPGKSDAQGNGKMAKHVLRCLAGFACSILEHERECRNEDNNAAGDTQEDDGYLCELAATRYRADHVASFVVESLVRVNHHYVRRMPTLLSPLWKSISEVADAEANAALLPTSKRGAGSPTIVRHAVRALLDHVQEGMEYFQRLITSLNEGGDRQGESGSSNADPHLVIFRGKIVDFLLDRLRSFLPLVVMDADANDEPKADRNLGDLTTIFRVLARLRGIFALLPHHVEADNQKPAGPSLMNAFAQLVDKLDGLVWSRLCRSDGTGSAATVDVPALDSLLDLHSPDPSERTVLFVGQAMVLIRVLERAVESPAACILGSMDDVDCLLRSIYALIFDVLSGAAAYASHWNEASAIISSLVTKFLCAASALLLLSEASAPCLAFRGEPGAEKFHHWLLSWLTQKPGDSSSFGPGGHPLSYELALSILHLYASGLGSPGKQRAFVKLAVMALFHPRTEAEFRRRVGCLLIRLSGGGRSAGDETAGLVSELAGPCIRNLARSLYGEGGSNKKRKRSRAPPRLSPMDLEILLSVVSKLELDDAMLSDARLVGGEIEPTFMNGPTKAAGLQFAALRAALATAASNRQCKSTTTRPHSCLLSYLAAGKGMDRSTTTPATQKYLLAFGVSVCEWIRTRCDRSKGGVIENPIMDEMCQILCQVLQSDRQGLTLEAIGALLSGIQALGTISRCISASIPKESLKGIARAFHELLSSREWTIRSACLSSMVQFAQTIDAVHRHILPTCVPESCRLRLSSRVKKKLIVSHEDLKKARSTCSAALARRYPKSSSARFLFSTSTSRSTTLIAAGSFFTTMPTQDGRQAIVIFPPCPESLKDIRFMLGISDEEEGTETLSQRLTVMKILGFEPTRDGSCTVMLDEETPM